MSALAMRVCVAVISRLGDTRRGATAIDCGLILALVVCVCISAFTLFGSSTASLHTKLTTIVGLLH